MSKTNKRNNTQEGLVKPKKARQSGWETVLFLREKSERDYQIRQEQLRMRQKEHENHQNMQQEQLEMMRIMQQQNNTMMAPLSISVNKNRQSVYFHELRISNALFNVVFVPYNLAALYLNLH